MDNKEDLESANLESKQNWTNLTNNEESRSGVIDLTGSDDEDEDLKLAIALSLQDESVSKILSAQAQSNMPTEVTPQSSVDGLQHLPIAKTVSSLEMNGTGLLSLDRKQMEAERLARLKRKRETSIVDRPASPPPLQRKLRALPHQNKPIPTQNTMPGSISSTAVSRSRNPTADMVQGTSDHPRLRYPLGKVLLTSMVKSQEQSISFAELLQPPQTTSVLKSALLSTFIVDFDWLFPHFDTRKVSFVLALHAQNDQEKTILQKDFAGIPNVRLVFPYVGGIVNCMHSKLMILFYTNTHDLSSTICRLVIPSANLVPWDWGVGGVMENILFTIDLPPLAADSSSNDLKDTTFKANLVQMLESMGTPSDVITKLDQYDFSRTESHGFVHSIGGSHILPSTSATGGNASIKGFLSAAQDTMRTATSTIHASKHPIRTGKICLSDAVASLGLGTQPGDIAYPPRIDFISSSIGNLSEAFLQSLFLSVCGRASTMPERTTKLAKASNATARQMTEHEKLDIETLTDKICVYFPSDYTVRNSKGGPTSAGTICFQSKWWDASTSQFPRNLLSDCVGVRKDKILMHSKILFVRYARPKEVVLKEASLYCHDQSSMPVEITDAARSKPPSSANKIAGWVYIGSANLSESAWASLVTDSKTKQPKINCRNWESGVLIPISAKPEHEGKNLHDLTLQEVFGDLVPVPIEYPGTNLVQSQRRPWFFNG